MKKYLLLLSVILFNTHLVNGQVADLEKLKWWDPQNSDVPIIEGQAWPKEVKNFYDRLPSRAEQSVRAWLWDFSRNSAGLKLKFRTDAEIIEIKYVLENKDRSMFHFPVTGFSGIDLYALNKDGSWAWADHVPKLGDTIVYRYENLNLNKLEYPGGREYHLYLPLYSTVKWLKIAVPEKNIFEPVLPRTGKPIVVYGTSIAQGGCASRAGLAWTAILERELGIAMVNLGFSANGRVEPEVVDLINEIDARVFVIDCLPNLDANAPSLAKEVEDKYINAVKKIRAKHPSTPILLTGYSGFIENRLDITKRNHALNLNNTLDLVYKSLRQEGVKAIFLLPGNQLYKGTDGTVDGLHPNDLGMYRHAMAYKKMLKSILKRN